MDDHDFEEIKSESTEFVCRDIKKEKIDNDPDILFAVEIHGIKNQLLPHRPSKN